LRLNGETQRALHIAGTQRFAGRLTQLPSVHRQPHQRFQVGAATRADPRAAKARLADGAPVLDAGVAGGNRSLTVAAR
jgi:hypothetical protein